MSINLLHLLSSRPDAVEVSEAATASPWVVREAPFASYLDFVARQQLYLQASQTCFPMPIQESLASVLLRKHLQDQITFGADFLQMGMPKASGSDGMGLELLASGAKLMDSTASPKIPPEKSLTTTKSGRGRIATFTQKMHEMLCDLEKEEDGTEIATFLPHGRGFVILKPKVFAEKVMPKYFQMSHFSSFQRQLNLYEFQRIKEGPDKGAYYHELFVRDQPKLCKLMKRIKIKGDKKRL